MTVFFVGKPLKMAVGVLGLALFLGTAVVAEPADAAGYRDHVEDHRDRAEAARDYAEDVADRREDRRDHREDHWDPHH